MKIVNTKHIFNDRFCPHKMRKLHNIMSIPNKYFQNGNQKLSANYKNEQLEKI